MGRIKTDMVKRTTKKLVELFGDKYSKDFTKNKIAVGETALVRSKKLRNVIAGYATRLKKQGEEGAFKVRKRKPENVRGSRDDEYHY